MLCTGYSSVFMTGGISIKGCMAAGSRTCICFESASFSSHLFWDDLWWFSIEPKPIFVSGTETLDLKLSKICFRRITGESEVVKGKQTLNPIVVSIFLHYLNRTPIQPSYNPYITLM